jgi:PleD family two-component response regulator
VCNHAYEDSSELLERADQALYAAKAEGRDRYVLAS